MANFSDGGPLPAETEDVFSDGVALMSAGSMRQYLQSLLDSKEKQLQQAGTLGQRVLAQQMELEERVRQLQDIDSERAENDEVSSEMRLRYRDLANTLKAWEEENVHLSSAFGNSDDSQPQPSPILPMPDLPQDLPLHGPSAPSASQSRRAKNAAHRANDVEFAFEIGSSLLTEVRRLQSLLAERDKAVQDMKEEKDDLEKAVDSLQTALRTQEQSTDKFKEENWNLEVSLQEMRVQLSNAQAAAQRGEAETKRLTKMLTTTRESNDSYKNEVERLKSVAEDTKTKHETDVALHRKHAAALAREKSDLQQSVDKYKVELARASRRLPRFGSPYTPDGHSDAQTPRMPEDDDDPFGPGTTGMGMSTNRRRLDTSALFPPDAFGPESVDNSPEPSPSRPFLAPNHPSNEIEALQQKLAHAQRQISTLKGTLGREKELRMEYRRRMIEGGMQGDRLDDDEDDEGVEDGEEDEEATEEGKVVQTKARARTATLRGRGRGRGIMLSRGNGSGRMTLAQKLGLSAQSPSSDQDDDDTEPLDTSDTFTSTIVPETSLDERTEADMSASSVRPSSPLSPGEPPSNRASVVSVDGMDPAFANVLRRAPSVTSIRRGVNPVIRGGVRGGRAVAGRRRGGTAYQEPRPSSLVGAPEALAAELGIGNTSVGMESVREDDVPDIEEREMKEFACQTENEEPPVAAIIPDPEPKQPEVVKPETAEMGIQVELAPEPEPEPVPLTVEEPAVIKVESSMQTEEIPRIHASVATDPHVPPVLVNSGTSTEPPAPVPTTEMEIQTEPEPEPKPLEQPEIVQEVSVRPQTPMRSEAETQTSPRSDSFPTSPIHALSGLPARRVRYLSSASTATAVPRTALHQIVQSEDEDAQTELAYASSASENEYTHRAEPETETDLDDYQDARSAAPTPSASDSLTDNVNDDDFHSMSTMTDNEFSSDEDDDADVESVKASIMNAGSRSSRVSPAEIEEEVVPKLVITYESQAIETDPPEEEPKRALSEISIQTDEWQPPPPPIISPPSQPSPGFGLYRVGPNSQQFQFVSPPPSAPQTAASTPISPHPHFSTLAASPFHESTNIAARPLRFSSPSLPVEVDKRKSSEFAPSGLNTDVAQRQHTQSLVPAASPVDKTRPPTMMLPPPPKMPPPPNSMPPPSFIPEKRRPPSALSSHREIPPPRPSSPPPPELIQRATTPTFGSVLTVPGRGMSGSRQHGSSLPPSSVLRQPLSTNSFRSASNAAIQAQMSSSSGGHFSDGRDRDRRLQSATSLLSDQEDIASRRSSLSSDFHPRALSEEHAIHPIHNVPTTPSRTANMTASTDPAIIHSITQTMIGEFLYKYTRRNFGKGHGERRHKRFFWVHPYTRTLYWSSADPGSTNVTEQSAKSAYIDSVRSVLDPNPMPPGLYQYSVVVSTPQREMKFTAPTKERHEIWLNALQYLLARPAPTAVPQSPTTQVNGAPVTPMRNPNSHGDVPDHSGIISPMSQRSGRSERSGMTNDSPWNITPRGGRRSRSRVSMGGSVGKRSGTPAAEYLRWADGPTSPSLRGRGLEPDDDEDLDFEIHDTTTSDQEGFEGLENVRACCDGRHTVGRASGLHEHHAHDHIHSHSHNHTHVHRPIPQFLRGDPVPEHLQPSRPVSPAFSFRSRASSRKSGEGSGNLFSRFGTRRSKAPPTPTEG